VNPATFKTSLVTDITEGGQYNEKTEKLRNITCIGYIQNNIIWQYSMFFRVFTFCSARVSALMIVLSDSLCERIGKSETCPILEEDRSLMRV
jgi:hypothetical protein